MPDLVILIRVDYFYTKFDRIIWEFLASTRLGNFKTSRLLEVWTTLIIFRTVSGAPI